MRRALRWMAASTAAAMMIGGCTFGSSSGESGAGGPLVVASPFEPAAGWAVETDDAFILTRSGVMESLTRLDLEGKLAPSLATDWKRLDDTTWRFQLRSGVSFHDGTPLDADAVVRALRHVLDADVPPRAFNPKLVAAVEPDGDDAVRIETNQPNPLLPSYLASPNTGILAAKAYEGKGIDPIEAGTGPFAMVGESAGQSIDLEANDAYWDGQPQIDQAQMRFIPDGGTRATMVQTGEAAIASGLPIAQVPTLDSDSAVTVVKARQPRTVSLYLNNDQPPFDDVRARRAIQAAIDVKSLVTNVLDDVGTPAAGPFPAWEDWQPEAEPIARDLDHAETLLRQAGIEPGTKLRLWTYTDQRPDLKNIATAIQEMLKEAGIEAELRVADYAALEPEVLDGNFDMFLLSRSHLNDVGDPSGFLESDYTCDGTYNLSHFCDPAFDRKLQRATRTEDQAARYALYEQLADQLQSQAVDTFVYHEEGVYGIASDVEGFQAHSLAHYLLTPQLTLND